LRPPAVADEPTIPRGSRAGGRKVLPYEAYGICSCSANTWLTPGAGALSTSPSLTGPLLDGDALPSGSGFFHVNQTLAYRMASFAAVYRPLRWSLHLSSSHLESWCPLTDPWPGSSHVMRQARVRGKPHTSLGRSQLRPMARAVATPTHRPALPGSQRHECLDSRSGPDKAGITPSPTAPARSGRVPLLLSEGSVQRVQYASARRLVRLNLTWSTVTESYTDVKLNLETTERGPLGRRSEA
jgi:hypothetical protein